LFTFNFLDYVSDLFGLLLVQVRSILEQVRVKGLNHRYLKTDHITVLLALRKQVRLDELQFFPVIEVMDAYHVEELNYPAWIDTEVRSAEELFIAYVLVHGDLVRLPASLRGLLDLESLVFDFKII